MIKIFIDSFIFGVGFALGIVVVWGIGCGIANIVDKIKERDDN